MNEVLAAVGVCVSADDDYQNFMTSVREKPALDAIKVDDVVTENSLGVILRFIDKSLDSLAMTAVTGLRHRLQVS